MQLRHADAGSCHGCELEIASASGRVYDAERAGARPTFPPRHADGVLATGLLKRNLAVPLGRTTEAVPRQVVAQALRLSRVARALVSGAGNRAAGRDRSLAVVVISLNRFGAVFAAAAAVVGAAASCHS